MPLSFDWASVERLYAGRFALLEVSEAESVEVAALVEMAIERASALAAFESSAARHLFKKYLGKTPAPLDTRTLSNEACSSLSTRQPAVVAAVYWLELDRVIEETRARVFRLVSSRLRTVLSAAESVVAIAHAARQLIELVDWAVYYQFCITSAGNVIRRILESRRPRGIFVCKTLEDIVRSPASSADDRFVAAAAVVGSSMPPVESDDVGEMTATIAKQAAILRWLSEHRDSSGGTGFVGHCERLGNAYRFLSGLSHVTPLLLAMADPGSSTKTKVEGVVPHVAMQVAFSATVLLEEFYYSEALRSNRLWPLFRDRFSPTSCVTLELGEFASFKTANDRLAFALDGGGILTLYEPRPRKAQLAQGRCLESPSENTKK